MDPERRVEQYAHRILKPLSGYQSSGDGDAAQPLAVPLRPGERVLGCYRPTGSESAGDVVVVTSQGLWQQDEGEWKGLAYRDIADVFPPETKDVRDNAIHLRMRDGTVGRVVIAGHRGRSADVWEFSRFVMRVIGSPGASD